jgi:hypothetical protein
MNYPVQGTGADAIKLGVCRMGHITRQQNTTYKTINLVHDDTIGTSELVDFDYNAKIFRESLEFSINYILKYLFHTAVEQDFCVLALCGHEVFLEGALTLKDIIIKLQEQMKEKLNKLQNEQDYKTKTNLVCELNEMNEALQKAQQIIKDIK